MLLMRILFGKLPQPKPFSNIFKRIKFLRNKSALLRIEFNAKGDTSHSEFGIRRGGLYIVDKKNPFDLAKYSEECTKTLDHAKKPYQNVGYELNNLVMHDIFVHKELGGLWGKILFILGFSYIYKIECKLEGSTPSPDDINTAYVIAPNAKTSKDIYSKSVHNISHYTKDIPTNISLVLN